MSSKVKIKHGRKVGKHETDVSFGMDGQRLKIVLSDVSYRRTKLRFSLFGVVGGVASILTALFGVLATLCDPELEIDGEVVVKGEGGGDGERGEREGERKKEEVPEEVLPEGWRTNQDAEGKSYYYNKTLGLTQWEAPATKHNNPKGTTPTSNNDNNDNKNTAVDRKRGRKKNRKREKEAVDSTDAALPADEIEIEMMENPNPRLTPNIINKKNKK